MTDVLTQVKENLLFYNLWTEVSEIHISNLSLLEGIPKEPLLTDETEEPSKREDNLYIDSSEDQVVRKSNKKEVVLPYRLDENLTPKQLKSIFDELEQVQGQRQRRIIIGIVNDDSTVVYYFIHDGVYKPKKN
jgi:tRNA-splicing endonuclease subunit Sen15